MLAAIVCMSRRKPVALQEPERGWFADLPAERKLLLSETAIEQVVRRLLQRVGDEEVIFAWLRQNPWAVGTMCSGTDASNLVFDALVSASATGAEQAWRVIHEFSCEKSARKRAFLRHLHKGGAVRQYKDTKYMVLGALADDDAASFLGQSVVPSTTAVLAGFPCTDISCLNKHARSGETLNCIADGTYRTGRCFEEICKYVESACGACDFVFLENVSALVARHKDTMTGKTTTMFEASVLRLEKAGFHVAAYMLQPWQMGWPVTRSRVYFSCVSQNRLRAAGIAPVEFDTLMDTAMQACIGHALIPLEDYLCSETSNAVQAYYKMLMDPGARSPKRSRLENPAWFQNHLEQMERAGMRWWCSFDCESQIFPGTLALHPREIDIVAVATLNHRSDAVIDVHFSLGRNRHLLQDSSTHAQKQRMQHENMCKIISPEARLYLVQRRRLLLGSECCWLQGIVYNRTRLEQAAVKSLPDAHAAHANEPNGLLQNLAGNAFHIPCLAAVLTSTIAAIARAERPRSQFMGP